MKQLYAQHRKLIKGAIILCIIVLIWGTVEVVSTVQAEKRKATESSEININEYTTSFKAYDVEGLTDEEIDMYLEMQRQQDGISQEGK